MKAVAYANLVAVLVEAVKALDTRLVDRDRRIAMLEAKLDTLDGRLRALERMSASR